MENILEKSGNRYLETNQRMKHAMMASLLENEYQKHVIEAEVKQFTLGLFRLDAKTKTIMADLDSSMASNIEQLEFLNLTQNVLQNRSMPHPSLKKVPAEKRGTL